MSKKVKDIVVTADVMRFQVNEGSLQAVRLFAVQNNSAPPRTQISDHNFEFYLPEGAQIDHCMARSTGGQPVRTSPLPQNEKNRYAFLFPLALVKLNFKCSSTCRVRARQQSTQNPFTKLSALE